MLRNASAGLFQGQAAPSAAWTETARRFLRVLCGLCVVRFRSDNSGDSMVLAGALAAVSFARDFVLHLAAQQAAEAAQLHGKSPDQVVCRNDP